MVDFATALATAGQALKLVNDLRGIQKAFDEAEWKLKVAELNGAIADLKNALVDAKEEVKAKDEELKLLGENFLVLKETVEFRGYKFDKKEDGKPTGHAYCPVCIQKDGYMFHLTSTWENGRPEQCPNCKAKFEITSFA
jgi:rubrerythrin